MHKGRGDTSGGRRMDAAKRGAEQPRDAGGRQPEGEDAGSVLIGLKPVLEYVREMPRNVERVYVRSGRRGEEIGRLLDSCREAGVRFSLVEKDVLERLAPGNSQGVAAQIGCGLGVELEDLLAAGKTAPLPLLAALDQVRDPGNAGTLARTLYALGGGGLLVPRHNSAHLGSAALKSSAGALARLPVARVGNLALALEEAADAGYAVYAIAKTPEAVSLFEARPLFPAVMVLGSEEKGIRPGVARRCVQSFFIPFRRDFDSLNVAQAGAIAGAWFLAAAMRAASSFS